MTHAADLPPWAALLTALLVLTGAGLTLAGAVGTLRFGSFYERVHAPTLGTSWGTAAIALASMVLFSALGSRAVVHELLIAIFITVTTPVTLMLLARAALYRDRTEGEKDVPPMSVVRQSGRNPANGEAGGAV
ncbi:MAG: monovalent cation/H(+) antiporter subunit G [Rhizobiaceae bacterium]|jgi:multicomponent K+:H+ antiporter subunit G